MMIKKYVLHTLGAMALCAVIAPNALAVPTYYEIGNLSSASAFSGPEPAGGSGLVIQTLLSPSLPGTNFTLNDGQSFTFSFFDIWTNETTVNTSNPLDDTAPKQITATLNFLVPNIDSTHQGTTIGTSVLYGFIQWGSVTWSAPASFTLGNLVFDVSLSDEIFNLGYFGLNEGQVCGATVEATVTQRTSGQSVPDSGSTAILFGLTLVGVTLTARKRVKA